MMELLGNAWSGWINYITQGKLAALFLVVLLVFWFWKKEEQRKGFVLYATVVATCCIVPVTAAVLMIYQTKFFDYQWIWSFVPLTAVIAYGVTRFLWEFWCEENRKKKSVKVWATLLCLGGILLCGSMGGKRTDYESVYTKILYPYGPNEVQLREQVYETIAALKESAGEEELILWGPVEVMEYAREADASVQLAYGRNMWDASLNAYSYDTYDETMYDMYVWMEFQNSTCDEEYLDIVMGMDEEPSGEACIRKALELGVNCVLLPAETYSETVTALEDALGTKARQLGAYWVIGG